jgi:hypothetical protein
MLAAVTVEKGRGCCCSVALLASDNPTLKQPSTVVFESPAQVTAAETAAAIEAEVEVW